MTILELQNKDALQLVLRAIGGAKSELPTNIDISVRGNDLTINGPDYAVEATEQMYRLACDGAALGKHDVVRAFDMVRQGLTLAQTYEVILVKPLDNKPIVARSLAQRHYIDQIARHDVTLGLGPAGVGKTWLAVAMGVRAYLRKEIKKIILTRPAMEAGEKLGFLPGTLTEKLDPYMRPLHDALYDMLPRPIVEGMLEDQTIEIAPLAYMRGRTLNDAFIILDEAQNTTKSQMKMFLTRLGVNSKMVVTGDPRQVDLPSKSQSGLRHISKVLSQVDGVGRTVFKSSDVMRHPMVQKIIDAYDKFDAEEKARVKNG